MCGVEKWKTAESAMLLRRRVRCQSNNALNNSKRGIAGMRGVAQQISEEKHDNTES